MNDRTLYRHLILALLLGACAVVAEAQYAGIYTFNGNVEGCCAFSPNLLAQGTDGYLYGTLPSGGAFNKGSWMQYAMSGVPTLIPLAGNGTNLPNTGLSGSNSGFTLGIDGNFYGASNFVSASSYGALFKMSGGTISTLYKFTGVGGDFPNAPPVQGLDGNLYGVTRDYGNAGYVYQVILSSTGTAQGWYHQMPSASNAPLLLASDGNFYGTYSNGSFITTSAGSIVPSPGGFGGIFKITPAGVVTWYYNLNPFSTNNGGKGDGQNPIGPVMQAADGNLYGTASGGGAYGTAGGVVYKIALNGTGYTPIHNFQFADGTAPKGGLVQGSDGNLYGLTSTGGTLAPKLISLGYVPSGTLFKVSTSGANFTLLFTFSRVSGANGRGPGSDPEATPVLHTNGRIYGLTRTGGSNPSGATTGPGGFDDAGEFFSYNAGLSPFVSVVGQRSAHVGDRVTIIGQGFLNATGVTFGGTPIPWVKLDPIIWNDNSMSVLVPSGAKTGPVIVQETTGNLSTLYNFTIACSGPLCRSLPLI